VCSVIGEYGGVRIAISIALASPKSITINSHGFNYTSTVILLLSTYPLKNYDRHYPHRKTVLANDLRICHFCLRVDDIVSMQKHAQRKKHGHEFSCIQNWGYFEEREGSKR
jgi:hypothetical protein